MSPKPIILIYSRSWGQSLVNYHSNHRSSVLMKHYLLVPILIGIMYFNKKKKSTQKWRLWLHLLSQVAHKHTHTHIYSFCYWQYNTFSTFSPGQTPQPYTTENKERKMCVKLGGVNNPLVVEHTYISSKKNSNRNF